MRRGIKFFALFVLAIHGGWSISQAQLPQDVRDVFERLIEDLDDDLAKSFQDAVQKNSATVEFTPQQFRRFRDDPINPFDGLDGITATDGGGNIALKFELPSLRGRSFHPLERQYDGQRELLRPVVGSSAASTVGIFNSDKQLALGIVIDAQGLIISKASEVETEEKIFCRFANGRQLPAKVVRVDKRNDIVLISVDVLESGLLQPIRWSTAQPLLGSFVLSPGNDGSVMALGTYSSNVRSTVSGEQAFLGVQPQTTPRGVLISDVKPGTASYSAGLRNGDVIVRLGDQPVKDVSNLVHQIRSKRPGDRIEIEYLRGDATATTVAELAGQRLSGERAARFKMMNRLGTIPSRRADGFPSVFQHDSPLFPEQCGGPIVDLDGNVIGLNIARNGRAASYAIPSNYLQTVIEKLTADHLAKLNPDSVQN